MPEDIVEQLDSIFKPKSLAVIGASNDPEKWGYWNITRLLSTGYRGLIYPINPREKEIVGLRAYPSVLKVPGDIDLAVVVVPAPTVPEVIEDCVKKGVKGAIIISAGFAETGQKGAVLQERVLKAAREGGIRFVGPNCLGLWSAPLKLNLCFNETPETGGISFVSQSGTFGIYLFRMATYKGYGFSKFVSVGNEADLNELDLLQYFAEDPDTKVIVFYIEGVKEGRKFAELAIEVVKEKPIIVFKPSRTSAGARAMMSHTASFAGKDEIFESACKQAGIIRVYEAFHPFMLAEALSKQPLPRGNRVAIISGGGGYCVTTTDACDVAGLEVPEFDEETKVRLKKELMPWASIPKNPVDLAADPRPETSVKVAEIVAGLDYIDGIIMSAPYYRTAFAKTTLRGYPDIIARRVRESINVAQALTKISRKYGKPIVCTAHLYPSRGLRDEEPPAVTVLREANIPLYEAPEDCVRAMQGLVKYAETVRRLRSMKSM